MNPGFGSWLIGMSLGTGGGMLGMASVTFSVLAATTFVAALLYAISGFGFAVLAAPLFLLFLDDELNCPWRVDEIAGLTEAFSDSDLPYKINLVDWRNIDGRWRQTIMAERVALTEAAQTVTRK
jgi:hypothetical protein